MDLTAYVPNGSSVTISATTASTTNVIQAAPGGPAGNNLRVVNESTSTALVSIAATTTPDATSDAKTMAVLAGSERIFGWQATSICVAVALRSGTGTVQIQRGSGF